MGPPRRAARDGGVGATIAGSAAAQAFVVWVPLRAREPWAWWCLAVGLLLWVVPDTTLSLRHGIWPNAVFNVFPALAIAVPLAFTRGHLRRAPVATPAA